MLIIETNPHFLAASQLVLSHICATLNAAAEKSVYFEIILSDTAGKVLISKASDTRAFCFPIGAKLPQTLLGYKEPSTVKSFSINGRIFSSTIVPITAGQTRLASGFLLLLINRDTPRFHRYRKSLGGFDCQPGTAGLFCRKSTDTQRTDDANFQHHAGWLHGNG